MGGAFWSAFVPCPSNLTDFSVPVSETLSQIDLLHRLTTKYSTIFSPPINSSASASSAFIKNNLLISPFAIEGLHQIGNSVSNLRLYHTLNVKYATLTHNCHNAFADAALTTNASGATVEAPPYWHGVSHRGRALVREMNRLGMLVDLAHVSKNTMLDVLGANAWSGSEAPIIFVIAQHIQYVHIPVMYRMMSLSWSRRKTPSSWSTFPRISFHVWLPMSPAGCQNPMPQM